MRPLPLIPVLLVALFDCLLLVKAQWILDNRCSRRALNQLGVPSNVSSRLERPSRSGTGASLDNNQGYWYSGLRGRSELLKEEVGGRNLFEEDPNSFMMRMHWKEGNCWQGEWIERKYCMECEAGDNCAAGNKLWTAFCDNSAGQKFVWVPNFSKKFQKYQGVGVNYGQLKLAYFDLCLERMTTNTFQMQKCNKESAYQVLVGWHPTETFELHPIENSLKCINQHHHPRPEEEIANTACDTARQFHTNLWKVYQNDNAGSEIVRMRLPQCSADDPCGKCEGDCDSSDQCEGDLICVQRSPDDGHMPVPGCGGFPNMKADYCASPEDLFAPPIPNHGLRVREPDCTAAKPCGHCQGDCDSDDGCKASMKCFIRGKQNSDEAVPNCAEGEGVPDDVDYCYEPNQALTLQAPIPLEIRPLDCGGRGKVCMQCQGDCDNDEDCYGPLECFQRPNASPFKAVPGCDGDGIGGADYCYLPEGVSFPTPTPIKDVGENENQNENSQDNKMRLHDEIITCSGGSCTLCMGDCDRDEDCKGSLVCFQRPWHEPYRKVPGCRGRGVPGADYCAEP